MKRFIFLVMLCISISAIAQDIEKRFSIFGYSDPVATYHDGFNFGLGVDYQMTLAYFKAQLFVFPKLRGNTYSEATGSVGINIHFGGQIESPFRIYTGIKAGKIWRASGHGGGTIGFEGGFDFTIPKTNLYFGIGGSDDWRTDGKAWGENEHNYWRLSGFGKVGYRF